MASVNNLFFLKLKFKIWQNFKFVYSNYTNSYFILRYIPLYILNYFSVMKSIMLTIDIILIKFGAEMSQLSKNIK